MIEKEFTLLSLISSLGLKKPANDGMCKEIIEVINLLLN